MQFVYMYKLFLTEELIRLGFRHSDIKRARVCCLRRLSRGVYVVRHVCDLDSHRPLWATIDEKVHKPFAEHGDSRDEIEDLSASLFAHYSRRADDNMDPAKPSPRPEVISHISAALMHNLPVAYPVTHQIEVVRPGTNRRFKSIHVRGNRIPSNHRTRLGGAEVTTIERTIIDVARSYNLDISVAMLDDALRRGLATKDSIRATLGQCLEKRNISKVHLALDLADHRRESPAESIAAVRFFQHGITGLEPQITFQAEGLGRNIRVDFRHSRARLIVEIDGLGKLYLGSGVPRQELEEERRREQWLRDRGWQVIRISWKELFQEAKFEQIRHAIRQSQAEPA
jgi:very-short-patch-repair endonuclease